ncbi:histidine phosphatase family protein [Chloroflexota bacterium]
MSRLLLIRHGETKGNSTERFWGRTDVELSSSGIHQVKKLRDHLALENISMIYSSNLCRALRTAEIIASRHEVSIVSCRELQEINFGSAEGLTYTEISGKYPDLASSWFSRDLDFQFPDGESVTDLNNRVIRFPDRLKEHTEKETIAVTAHSGVLRLLICNLLGVEPHHWRQIRLDLASLSIIETYPETAILSSLNDISHLKAKGG